MVDDLLDDDLDTFEGLNASLDDSLEDFSDGDSLLDEDPLEEPKKEEPKKDSPKKRGPKKKSEPKQEEPTVEEDTSKCEKQDDKPTTGGFSLVPVLVPSNRLGEVYKALGEIL